MSVRAPDLARILDVLEAQYGPQTLAGPTEPFLMLVFLYSGYPASDVACARGFAALKRDVGVRVEEILAAPRTALVKALRAGGIVPEQRASRLKNLARVVKDEYGGDLAAALKAAVRATKLLQQFPSVAEPTAAKILLFAKLAPVAAVPSGNVDVCSRLWRGEPSGNYAADYRAARVVLEAGLPEKFAPRQRAYLLLKRHGQETCKRSAPRCEVCPLTGSCAYIRERAKD